MQVYFAKVCGNLFCEPKIFLKENNPRDILRGISFLFSFSVHTEFEEEFPSKIDLVQSFVHEVEKFLSLIPKAIKGCTTILLFNWTLTHCSLSVKNGTLESNGTSVIKT